MAITKCLYAYSPRGKISSFAGASWPLGMTKFTPVAVELPPLLPRRVTTPEVSKSSREFRAQDKAGGSSPIPPMKSVLQRS